MKNNNISTNYRSTASRAARTTHLRTGARVSSPSSGVRPGARALNLELPTSFGFRLFMGALCLLVGSFLFSNIFLSHSAYAAFSASISRSGTISIAEPGSGTIRPTSAGTLGIGSDKVSVTTNCTYGGYKLYVSATSTGGTNLNRSGATASELTDASNYITTSTTATGSETTLSRDTWGVGKTASAFAGVQSYTANAGSLTPLYSGTSSDSYDFYYGINVSTAKTPGTYTGEVLYTVLMDEACTKYTLNFNGNNATTNTLTPQELDFDSTINLADISSSSKIARTGYTLSGWKDQNNKSYGITGTADVNPNDLATVTLTAQWQLNSYAVTVNKGSNVTTVGGANTYNYNSTVTIAATAFATGYHFNGWTVNSGGATLYSNSAMTAQSTTSTPAYFRMPDNAVTVTASAAANTYTIAYAAGNTGGTCSVSSTSATYDQNVALSSTKCTKSNAEQKGWSTTNSASNSKTYDLGQTLAKPNLTATNGGTVTLYPYFEDTTPTMQNFTTTACNSMSVGSTTTRPDSRDNITYTIIKAADNKCWMADNLRFTGYTDLGTASKTSGSVTLNTSTSSGNGTVQFSSEDSASSATALEAYYGGDKSIGARYTWAAAKIVCPAKWHLTTGGPDGEFCALDRAVNSGDSGVCTNRSNSTVRDKFINAIKLNYPNTTDWVGLSAQYWSSTESSSTQAYELYMNKNYGWLQPVATADKVGKQWVRCVFGN